MYEIVVGRDEADKKRFGDRGTFMLGRHYVKMGQTTSLSNEIYMDAARPHVVFVCGKRGSGKSYTLAAMAEAMMASDVRDNLAVVMIDTMGIFWTMKYENKRDEALLKEWGLKPSKLAPQVYVPEGYFQELKSRGIADFSFSIKPAELTAEDWCMTFNVSVNDPVGVVIARAVNEVRKHTKNFSLQDVINEIKDDIKSEQHSKDAAENHFAIAQNWGLFSEKGTEFSKLAEQGQITIIDVSCFAALPASRGVRALVIGLVCQKLFEERMIIRRDEELAEINVIGMVKEEREEKMPITWVFVDEAHEFLPKVGSTVATKALLALLREGRQPGISLVLASQQPGQIHTDVMTQSDIVISHRITAKIDIDALGALMQSYMREGLDKAINDLPDEKGAALIFDDTNERMYPVQIRPRISWHGGASPTAFEYRKREITL